MNKPIRPLLLALLLLASFTPRAQDEQQTQTQQDKGATGQQQANQDKNRKKQQSVAKSFKPSEEISEDLSVSFPVDI